MESPWIPAWDLQSGRIGNGNALGDIDPALISHVAKQIKDDKGLSLAEAYEVVMTALNKESGLRALSGNGFL